MPASYHEQSDHIMARTNGRTPYPCPVYGEMCKGSGLSRRGMTKTGFQPDMASVRVYQEINTFIIMVYTIAAPIGHGTKKFT